MVQSRPFCFSHLFLKYWFFENERFKTDTIAGYLEDVFVYLFELSTGSNIVIDGRGKRVTKLHMVLLIALEMLPKVVYPLHDVFCRFLYLQSLEALEDGLEVRKK